MTGPLVGIRVIEFGNLVAAPYCGMLLADLGADVVKVEPPGGDLSRQIGPFINGESGFFLTVNRGKRSIVLDSKNSEARRLLWELARQADVLIHNLRQGAMERMGLGHQDLAGVNPGLIYAAISAFGTSGPDADRAGIDLIFQGESGMMSVAGEEGDPPQKTATTIGDYLAGTNAALLVSAALAERGVTGSGKLLEVTLRDGLVAVQGAWNAQYFVDGMQPRRTGTASPVTAPNQTFATADGHLNVAIVSNRHFVIACRLLGLDQLVGDDRFADNKARVEHRAVLAAELQEIFSKHPTDHWLRFLGEAGLPVGRIMTLPEVFSDPQVLHNSMVLEVEHPVAGIVRYPGSPLRWQGEPLAASRRPPLLGEHTTDVVSELGVTGDRLRAVLDDGDASLG